MNIKGKAYRTIWLAADGWSVEVIDQTKLPHELASVTLRTMEDAAAAIRTMQVRGAPLIGATAAYGVCLALRADASDAALDRAIDHLGQQRPTAVNLRWALEEMRAVVRNLPREKRLAAAYARAAEAYVSLWGGNGVAVVDPAATTAQLPNLRRVASKATLVSVGAFSHQLPASAQC
jgi:methylthioribose-1-phosphate isomerase